MTMLGAWFFGARSGFETREHRDPRFCVLEGRGKIAVVTYLLVSSLRLVGRGLLILEMHGVYPYEIDRRPLNASG